MKWTIEQKERYKDIFFRLVFIFLIGGIVGCVYETILCYFQRGYFESRRGVIYTPFNPVYAFGAVAMYLALKNFKRPLSIFSAAAVTGGLVEYFCSFFQETVFGTTSWNYSKYFMNFHGRTSLFHMLVWGAFGLLFIDVLYPAMKKTIYKIKKHYRVPVCIVILAILCLDMLISSIACYRYQKRQQGYLATNSFEEYIDKNYPDELIKKIYPHAKGNWKKVEKKEAS